MVTSRPASWLTALLLLLATTTSTAFTPLSTSSLKSLLLPTDADFDITTGALLAPILIPRVPGTPGSLKVLTHFHNFFTSSLPGWHLSTQNSTATTPTSKGKKVPFVNFMATRDPPWTTPGDVGRLVLVAHYDSKLTPDGFIGATDSAVPCAVLLHTAKAIDGALERKWKAMQDKGDYMAMEEERGVMILFLDGEEAFENWTDEDSLYGARNLAQHWESTFHPAMSTRKTLLNSIDLFVLLDLLGTNSPPPRIPSYFITTHWAYRTLAATEQLLRKNSLFRSHKKDKKPWFYQEEAPSAAFGGMIQDDHVPFMERGVEILHVIPSPFPHVWHRIEDDAEHLDADVVADWATLIGAWTLGFMGAGDWAEGNRGRARERDEL